eukprot:TRINITY_DN10272_c0_g1_i2.p1 TRINITY_DN10272_c0_g1~~TRINITY_DN10272_c0_g1_i2.p1  ORF type:complete len:535 (-),score=92.68 TRINITY_DN10272_c0_g1_i2:88-1692(-)
MDFGIVELGVGAIYATLKKIYRQISNIDTLDDKMKYYSDMLPLFEEEVGRLQKFEKQLPPKLLKAIVAALDDLSKTLEQLIQERNWVKDFFYVGSYTDKMETLFRELRRCWTYLSQNMIAQVFSQTTDVLARMEAMRSEVMEALETIEIKRFRTRFSEPEAYDMWIRMFGPVESTREKKFREEFANWLTTHQGIDTVADQVKSIIRFIIPEGGDLVHWHHIDRFVEEYWKVSFKKEEIVQRLAKSVAQSSSSESQRKDILVLKRIVDTCVSFSGERIVVSERGLQQPLSEATGRVIRGEVRIGRRHAGSANDINFDERNNLLSRTQALIRVNKTDEKIEYTLVNLSPRNPTMLVARKGFPLRLSTGVSIFLQRRNFKVQIEVDRMSPTPIPGTSWLWKSYQEDEQRDTIPYPGVKIATKDYIALRTPDLPNKEYLFNPAKTLKQVYSIGSATDCDWIVSGLAERHAIVVNEIGKGWYIETCVEVKEGTTFMTPWSVSTFQRGTEDKEESFVLDQGMTIAMGEGSLQFEVQFEAS